MRDVVPHGLTPALSRWLELSTQPTPYLVVDLDHVVRQYDRFAAAATGWAVRSGDHIDWLSAGAYTTCYSAAGFNGLTPPPVYFVQEGEPPS